VQTTTAHPRAAGRVPTGFASVRQNVVDHPSLLVCGSVMWSQAFGLAARSECLSSHARRDTAESDDFGLQMAICRALAPASA
jgi:hypothetical protein